MKTVYNFLLNAAILLIFFPLSCVITVFMLFFGSSLGDCNVQYKRIGNTEFYIMDDYISGAGSFLYYSTYKAVFEDVQTQNCQRTTLLCFKTKARLPAKGLALEHA